MSSVVWNLSRREKGDYARPTNLPLILLVMHTQFLATGLQRDRNSPLERMRVWQFPDPQLPRGRVWVNVLELICFAVIQKQQTMVIRRLPNDVPDWLAAMRDRDGTAAAVR